MNPTEINLDDPFTKWVWNGLKKTRQEPSEFCQEIDFDLSYFGKILKGVRRWNTDTQKQVESGFERYDYYRDATKPNRSDDMIQKLIDEIKAQERRINTQAREIERLQARLSALDNETALKKERGGE